jgi:sugar transferase (PEP-CTERM/EpsH1 system associated)
MHILFLSSRLPYPPDRGDRLRLYNIIKKLSCSHHDLYLISFIEGKSDNNQLPNLRRYFKQITVELLPPYKSYLNAARSIFSRMPLQIAYYQSKNMQKLVDLFLRQHQIDLIYVHLFRMAPYVEDCRNIYKTLDLTDVVSGHLERSLPFRSWLDRQLYSIEWRRIRSYEKMISEKFDECWVISETEAKLLSSFSSANNVKIIPNGVDFYYFTPVEAEKKCQLIFVGYLKSAYNVDAILFFSKHIFPLVKKVIPDVNFCIVGTNPHHRIRNLATVEGIKVKGFVEDLGGILNSSKVFVAPFRFCSGIQNKILEAMAAGLPVVCTTIAAEGINAGPNEGLLVANDPKEFSEYLIDLLRNDQKRKELGCSARQFVQKHYSWDYAVQRINEIESILSSDRHTFTK